MYLIKTTGALGTEAWVETAVMLNTSRVHLIYLATWDLSFYWKKRSYNSHDLVWEPSDLECVKCKLVLMKRSYMTSKMTTFNYIVTNVIIQALITLVFIVVVVVTIIIRMKMLLPQFLKIWRKHSSPTRRSHSEIRIFCLEGQFTVQEPHCRTVNLGSRVPNPWLVSWESRVL